MKSQAPDQWRYTRLGDRFSTTSADGMNGVFLIPLHKLASLGHKVIAFCIVSNGTGNETLDPWEHVSVRIHEYGNDRIPSWKEMCLVKDVFWTEDEVVMQLHPAKKDHINDHPCVLHLWKPVKQEIPTPPKIFV